MIEREIECNLALVTNKKNVTQAVFSLLYRQEMRDVFILTRNQENLPMPPKNVLD